MVKISELKNNVLEIDNAMKTNDKKKAEEFLEDTLDKIEELERAIDSFMCDIQR